MDDVIKVAGHRLANAEVENAINMHDSVAGSAVVSKADKIKGEVPVAFVILKKGTPSEQLKKEIVQSVEKGIGPTARPSEIFFVDDVPKTRSGKIMRRVLKTLIRGEKLGDLTTLLNPECIDDIKKQINKR